MTDRMLMRPRPFSQGLVRANPVAHIVLIAGCLYFLVPLAWLVLSSTKTNGDLFTTGLGFGHHFAFFDNVAQLFAFRGGMFWLWLGNSLLYSFGGSIVATAISAAAGYAFAKFRFAGRSAASNVLLASVMVPAAVLALPLYLLFSQVQLTDTVWSVLLPSCLSPFGVYLARVYCAAAIADEVLESARIDGASEFRIFASIGIPMISPGLVTIFLFQFIAIWNNFFLPFVMLSSDANYTVTLGLQVLSTYPPSQGLVYYNLIITGSVISVIPLAVSFLVLQRWWRSGLALGSVVG